MSEEFLLILIGMIFSFILGFLAVWTVFRNIISNKYLKESKKLQLLINQLKREYGELVEEPQDFISGALGSIGIEGLMKQFGVDPSILKNPVVQGFISKYAPKLIEQLKGGAVSGQATQTNSQV